MKKKFLGLFHAKNVEGMGSRIRTKVGPIPWQIHTGSEKLSSCEMVSAIKFDKESDFGKKKHFSDIIFW